MSWSINERTGAIVMTKGDTPAFKVVPKYRDQETGEMVNMPLQEGDTIIFAVKKEADNPCPPCIVKTVPIDTCLIQFSRDDTKYLAYGTYRYEVSFSRGEYTCTFIEGATKTLTLTSEIY